ncbi:MAG: AAA family ATPase [Planctomycetaceae bacterium]|nr:AAA family ATPase [Planctomycetaceae bacterium]
MPFAEAQLRKSFPGCAPLVLTGRESTARMYEKYWKLTDNPFRNTPDPRYFHLAHQYEEALARALYVVTEGQGAMLLTGSCGCGKTLLTRVLVDELDPARFEVALIPYPNLEPQELLSEILRQFGFDIAGLSKPELIERMERFLDANRRRGATTLVIVDEGQIVHNDATLEEIRLLLNFQQDRSFALTLLLVGQPELRARIEGLPQLSQRLTVKYHLRELTRDESAAYLRHRLGKAGGDKEIFTKGAEDLIIDNAGGVPRRLNFLSDLSLLSAFGKAAPLVDEEIVEGVLADRRLAEGEPEEAVMEKEKA